MYNELKDTKFEKFVANPQKGSMHNYGIAVDITIVDHKGKQLDMGYTPFGKNKAQLYLQYAKYKMGVPLTKTQKANRQLLADSMVSAGFIALSYEWWHFNGLSKKATRAKYNIIE
ncbi:MAG: D-alanyl-D-alanine dipeptidase [Candidatus Magnetoglobus multicellularis str. Araruama]|uniref:D-alanyl-D-alanine dipeptidase n=1 Tax=Candidatus Magnetoglobus multicellularis str. Araruama TaxID=890399 RepID=A0A1V1NQX3_9BACT|nr:MAG: D-alanyl-D-alanine dipeptidase [Candidatus Magnetoglobus multicellularis str. Araruama]